MSWFLHSIIFVELKKEYQICQILNNNIEFLQLKHNRKEAMSISLYIHSFIDQALDHLSSLIYWSINEWIYKDHLHVLDTNKKPEFSYWVIQIARNEKKDSCR